ncbi:Probable alanine aminotransferase, mitochondrial [Seminavis robusta]|uniref:Probable alanine aminotransferase, mitochondrial n=1 Tax=Seminavis robusta TaxID=568900 RepID=A0A9N8EB59_9STRA|nr:Probable alanine aminotransferase, mitochondrial [Seminavis robusta]|eukprot:Sro913_g219410.1 Probable alanine aminotransferase, mitochondrial (533) ;mRNA; r:8132-9854
MTRSPLTTGWLLLGLPLLLLDFQSNGVLASVAPREVPKNFPSISNDKMKKRLTEESMSQNIRQMEYAVRGKIVIAAEQIRDELSSENHPYDFDHVVFTNIGNPQSVGQKPLTWPRQVMALVDLPDHVGVNHPLASQMFPADAIRRAKEIKAAMACGSSGAYSHSKGVKLLREDVVKFISHRDGGVQADPEDIFLTNGASTGIVMILNALLADSTCGVLIPIPQYPIYSATIDQFGGNKVGYFLDEANGWDLNLQELERALQEARSQGINVNSMVLINPGNPTGGVLKKKTIKEVVKFCVKHKLVLLADEVYQENVYDEKAQFVSVKRVAHELGVLQKDKLELASFHSTSKGVFGECGRRGGYMELVGFDPVVKDHIYKLASSGLCSSLNGQVMTALMCRGPEPGEESYDMHEAEKQSIYQSLKRRSQIVTDGLNRIPGFSCQPAQGAMYSFPAVQLPEAAVEAAKIAGLSPDTLYALSLLERTGICVVPASGFSQKEGRFGFRTTFLPSEAEMERCVELFRSHHEEFCQKYA